MANLVTIRTVAHVEDLRYIDSEGDTFSDVYAYGLDRCGWEIKGFMRREVVAELLFPDVNA